METEINQKEKESRFYNHTGSACYWWKLVWNFKIPA